MNRGTRVKFRHHEDHIEGFVVFKNKEIIVVRSSEGLHYFTDNKVLKHHKVMKHTSVLEVMK